MLLKLLKGLLFFLALWYFAEWGYDNKLKPFLLKEFGSGQAKTDSLGQVDSIPKIKTVVTDPQLPGDPNSRILGIDLSAYNGKEVNLIDSSDKISFVYCRATNGLRKDSIFDYNCSVLAKKKFLVFGAYHVYNYHKAPDAQAGLFLKTIRRHKQIVLPPMIDIERSKKFDFNMGHYPNAEKDLLSFIKIIEDSTGMIPIIYTNFCDGNKLVPGEKFGAYPLWIAHYSASIPKSKNLPAAWKNKTWAIWQQKPYLFHGDMTDYDIFNGDMQAFKDFISNSMIVK